MLAVNEQAQSRRALLAGGLGALVALMIQAVTRPFSAAATHGDVHLGQLNTAATRTTIEATSATGFRGVGVSTGVEGRLSGSSGYAVIGTVSGSAATGVRGNNTATIGNSYGVYGSTSSAAGRGVYGRASASSGSTNGVRGETLSPTGVGVEGVASASSGGIGVQGTGPSRGVVGRSAQSDGMAVVGIAGNPPVGAAPAGSFRLGAGVAGFTSAFAGAGVLGTHGSYTGVAGRSGSSASTDGMPPTTGVYGVAHQTITGAIGVLGRSVMGPGVRGESESGVGVHGLVSVGGIAVKGNADGSGGVALQAVAGTGATALDAAGPVKFSSSGVGVIPSGTSSLQVTPGVDLTASSKVLVTINGDAGAGVTLQRVSVNVNTDVFTVILTANAATNTRFSWFVIS